MQGGSLGRISLPRGIALLVVLASLLVPAVAVAQQQGDIYDCKDFQYQEDAQAVFIATGGPRSDVNGLDPDNNGQACDSGANALPRRPVATAAPIVAATSAPAPVATVAPAAATPAPAAATPAPSPLPTNGANTGLMSLAALTALELGIALVLLSDRIRGVPATIPFARLYRIDE
jgi:hypothetical protein